MENIIKELIKNELIKANKKFPKFQSRHEAYGVIKEEIEETLEELEAINKDILIKYWNLCRNSKHDNKNEALMLLNVTFTNIINSIKELIQVGAMIEKSKKLEK